MSDQVPNWLSKALKKSAPGKGQIAVATLASENTLGRGGFQLTSPAFADGEALDPCFTADEEDAVAPPLEWTAPPAGTQELAIVVEDAHSAGAVPVCHWLVWGLAPQKGMLLEGETPPRVGKNSQKNSEWLLPEVPQDGDAHDFVFQLFALDLPLTLMPGASRAQLVKEMEGHVIAASVLTGTYKRSEFEDDKWEDEEDA
ncbi:YbhB/YbcL family Raf kinase inhibitor-like protein [Altererythrobacter aquiaggeris]|uniref:YbhB/YbcL family Raf kinase inhibitor-like protein n=1 Tax=Aestuarierythrobacter aquiaggeris TaxID=1898396 RepID=UPI00301986B0